MSALSTSEDLGHPIEQVSAFIVRRDWFFRQAHRDEILVDVPGRYGQYQMKVRWDSSQQTLDIACQLDSAIEDSRLGQAVLALAVLNEDVALGHFQLILDSFDIELRYRLALRGTGGMTSEQVQDILDVMIDECEHAAPALYQLASSNDLPPHTTRLVMMPVQGEA